MMRFMKETGIVVDAVVAYLVCRLWFGKDRAMRRWNQELDRLVK